MPELAQVVARHYDSLATLYRVFWGEHIHHGLWPADGGTPRTAQEQLVSHLASRAQVARGSRVLDVGCGYGASGRWLAAWLDCQVTGITISTRQARYARRLNRSRGLSERSAVLRGDAAALPFRSGAFDVVWVIECLEHLADKAGFVADVARLLRPGGRFALCSWQRGDADGERLLNEVCEAFLCPSLASQEQYRDWCGAAGLEVVHAEDLTPRVSPTWDILMRRTGRPWLAPLRLVLDGDARRFLDGFPAIAEAYRTRAMSYGLLIAERP
jgi:tocopherol O-methyltransferase